MPKKIDTVYWDSCVWIAWIKEEKKQYPDDFKGIEYSVRLIEDGKQRLVNSSIVDSEVYPEKMDDETRDRHEKFTSRGKKIYYRAYDEKTAKIYREIMDCYRRHKPPMQPPDAQHLAIAIYYDVDAFYTFDEGKSGGMNLLALDGNVAGYPLKICKPPKPPLPPKRPMDDVWG